MIDSDKILKINVKASTDYAVIIGRNVIQHSGEIISEVLPTCKIALITDDRVNSLYADVVVKSLENSGYNVVKFYFKNGEKSKNLNTYGQILNFLAENELTRTDAIVALGGGVVGDMAGFAAATYLRGIKYVQIPTTLLSQIDSSVGGKTAIDLDCGKNLVGAFCQPIAVICDVNVLFTLPGKIFSDGMGEVAKYAILDKRIFDLVMAEEKRLVELIYLCVDYKRSVVEADEFENGDRKLLNLGHTPAHGIEKLSGYSIAHGSAVAMGINIILDSSLKHGYLDEKIYKQLKDVVLNTAGVTENPFDVKDICNSALADKKRSGDYITLVMVHNIGDCKFHKIKVSELTEYLV